MVAETSVKEELAIIKLAVDNPKYFEPIYDRYFEDVLRFVNKRLNDLDKSSDLTQEIFIKAMLNLHKFEYRGFPFSSWLFKIAYNEVNSFFRKRSKEKVVYVSNEEILPLAIELDSDLEQKKLFEVRWQQVVDAINLLNDDQQKLIELRFMDKMPFKEIALLVGISESNAKIKVFRAIKKLRGILLNEQNSKN